MRLIDADKLTLMDVHLIDGVFVCDAPTVNAVSEEVYTREYNLRKDAEFKVYKLEKAIGEIKERIEEMIDKNTTFDSDNSRAQIIALEWVSEVIDEKVKEYKR